MLKSRVITSLIMALAVIGALLLLPPTALTLVVASIFLGVGGWESANLAGMSGVFPRLAWIALLAVAGAGLIWLTHFESGPPAIFAGASLMWLVLTGWLRSFEFGKPTVDRFQPFKLIVLGLVMLAAFTAISWLHFYSPWRVIFLVLVVAAADIGAYFCGRHFGGFKLAPRISPGKTWSGMLGGLIAAALVAAAAAMLLPSIPLAPAAAAAAAVILAALSVAGDLLISLLKRHRNLKDTSSLLPGHGGLLDRVDGLCAAAPLFALLVWFVVSY